MPTLPIRHFPDPVLKAGTQPVTAFTPALRKLVDRLIATMRHHPRCVGLAAPQVGVGDAVAVVDVTGHPKAKRSHGLIVLINPKIVAHEEARVQREGCLSVPDLTGNVSRAVRVEVEAQDVSGERWRQWFEEFEAVAMQHEIDHLNGLLFLDRIANLRTNVFRRQKYA
jgi:peptide deformylase